MLKVYIEPPAHLSRAMFRVARALRRYAPANMQFVSAKEADFHVLHVIGNDAIPYVEERQNLRYAVVQYCYTTAGSGQWNTLWDRADVVWSYYDLPHPKLYRAPLGLDDAFRVPQEYRVRTIGIMTSGYVAGPGAEAIEEVYLAASRLNQYVVHLGPMPIGFLHPPNGNWQTVNGISDSTLAEFYTGSKWVSGLRHVEGFELPALEGLACGARPILFNREDMHTWYDDYAEFIPECHGEELVAHLVEVMKNDPKPVTAIERIKILQQFNWEPIVEGFWERVTG